ncbi:tRNA (adenosine(37)-N6)-dimethylallyltransferase MiaA [Xylophilus sp. GOD-11R]|uniref:tRNA (adenosine(37)-N6)-dimethylallyltransferase MiaA n=1 Tax=Xylophilus sp. GOD-11R TaxID=3089814 RepID=UPI00298D35B3|nr:tRNA (adenosine(37)-N6)-dimethylallyltransferase MiaA [Xylophilus sp. GOD-11R]WPB58157.1 tRNA (adenosine(37)-N6)-dimethylallyltransferase MiaA [Xylophilus sp. GOD-11R]
MPGAATNPASFSLRHPLPVISLAGPTASGKTAAAIAIAQHLAPRFPVEIVSVDSALIYRDMDIGTAKPDAAERAAAPHHLIDIRDPTHSYSAAAFVADAQRCIAEIRERGALPLLVGGTMLYFKALFDGLDAMPPADADVRAAIDAQALERGWPALHAELAQVDSPTAQRLAPNDSQRIQRALEVWRSTGRPLSDFHQRTERAAAEPGEPCAAALISLEPADRAWLHRRIEQRFDAMLALGFLDEVRRLRRRGDLSPDLPSMRCVGYRQAWEALDEADPPTTQGLARLRERGIAATRQLAKRQFTWLRSLPQRHIVPADAPDALPRVIATVDSLLEAVHP